MIPTIIGVVFACMAGAAWVMIANLAYKFHILLKRAEQKDDPRLTQLAGMAMLTCLVMLFMLAFIGAQIALKPDTTPTPEKKTHVR